MSFHHFFANVLLLALFTNGGLAQDRRDPGIEFSRARHLQHGINASEWFAQSSDYSTKRLTSYTTPSDMDQIRQMGFDHVRLSIDPAIFACMRDEQPCEPVAILDQIVSQCLKLDLAVIVDVHPDSHFKRDLATDDSAVERFAALWKRIALHFRNTDRERIFFEILNEPEMRDSYRWSAVQHKVLLAIREAAPLHTVIVSGARWSDIEDMVVMGTFAETNLIYNFHYYEPHIFTHQGATWGENFWAGLRQVPYPASPKNVEDPARSAEDELVRWRLTEYGLEKWDRDRVNGEISFAAKWAAAHHVPVICSEFGVYRTYSDEASRTAWLSDVRSALEDHHVGWSMWDYRGGFGVVSVDKSGTHPDTRVLHALGLKQKPAAD